MICYLIIFLDKKYPITSKNIENIISIIFLLIPIVSFKSINIVETLIPNIKILVCFEYFLNKYVMILENIIIPINIPLPYEVSTNKLDTIKLGCSTLLIAIIIVL